MCYCVYPKVTWQMKDQMCYHVHPKVDANVQYVGLKMGQQLTLNVMLKPADAQRPVRGVSTQLRDRPLLFQASNDSRTVPCRSAFAEIRQRSALPGPPQAITGERTSCIGYSRAAFSMESPRALPKESTH